jgi:hypothetical protein
MPSVYAFSAPLNWLDWDPTYPKNPRTLADYIRKYRKDEGLLIRDCNSDTAEGWREVKRTGSTFDGWFGNSISKRPREAMIWPSYFGEARQ